MLSEHEQRLLEQMEQAFRVECPDLDASLDGRRGPRARLRLGVAVLIVLAGVVVLLVGVVVPVVWLGVAGFVVMLAVFLGMTIASFVLLVVLERLLV